MISAKVIFDQLERIFGAVFGVSMEESSTSIMSTGYDTQDNTPGGSSLGEGTRLDPREDSTKNDKTLDDLDETQGAPESTKSFRQIPNHAAVTNSENADAMDVDSLNPPDNISTITTERIAHTLAACIRCRQVCITLLISLYWYCADSFLL
jgi:hypothetical protein